MNVPRTRHKIVVPGGVRILYSSILYILIHDDDPTKALQHLPVEVSYVNP